MMSGPPRPVRNAREWAARAGIIPWYAAAASGFVQRGLKALYTMDYETRNLLKYSEAFDNNAWSKTGVVLTPAAALAPDGRSPATLIRQDATLGMHRVFNTVQNTPGFRGAFSVYLKSAGARWAYLAQGGASNSTAFDLVNGTMGRSFAGSQPATMEDAGDGWYRCRVTLTDTGDPPSFWWIGMAEDGTEENFVHTFQGDGASGILVWGAQLTEGEDLLPYVPTTDKQALYDYSGNVNDAYLGSVGSAHINPVSKALWLPGTVGNSISTPNTTGGTAYWRAWHLDGSTVDGDTGDATVTVGGTSFGAAILKAVRVYSDSGRTELVAEAVFTRDAPGDVTRFSSKATGELWTINQATASDTNDPTWTGEGLVFDGSDDSLGGLPTATESFAVEDGAYTESPSDYGSAGGFGGTLRAHGRYGVTLSDGERARNERAAKRYES